MRRYLVPLFFVALHCSPLCAFEEPASEAVKAREILRKGIGSRDPDIRVRTIVAASMIGQHEAVIRPLESNLQDKNDAVRIAAIGALADLRSTGSGPALEEVMKNDKIPEVRFAAAKALYRLNNPAGAQALTDIFRKKFVTNSNMIQTKERDLLHNFHSPLSAMTFVVNEGIGYVPVPGVGEGFSAMMEILNDPDLSDRASALLLITRDKNAQADELLKAALKDGDWSVRASAAQVIAHSARSGMMDDLPPLFEDKEVRVRFRAAGAYLHLYLLKFPEK